LENFATELLAWTVNHCPDFGLAFAQLFLQPDDAAPALSVRASTQRFLGRYGIADLWLDVEFGERRSTVLLVESKVEADIGERERADSVEGEIDVPDEEPELNTQVHNYLRFAESHSPCWVGVLTKYRSAVRSGWEASSAWTRQIRWMDVGHLLGVDRPLTADAQNFLRQQFQQFLREHGMTLEKVGPELVAGTKQRQALWQMLHEVAEDVGQSFGLNARRGYDQWAIYVTWTDSSNGPVARLAYSDGRGDAAICVDPRVTRSPEAVAALRDALPAGLGPDTKRFWGRFYIPVYDFGQQADFFALGAKEQAAELEGRCRPILEAVLSVSSP
jgi:hypothetical protein